MFPRSRYRDRLEDERLSAWIENVSRGSRVNADVSPLRIGCVCKLFKVMRSDLATLTNGRSGDLEKERSRVVPLPPDCVPHLRQGLASQADGGDAE